MRRLSHRLATRTCVSETFQQTACAASFQPIDTTINHDTFTSAYVLARSFVHSAALAIPTSKKLNTHCHQSLPDVVVVVVVVVQVFYTSAFLH